MKIELENVGPIVEFAHEFKEYGVHVLKGRQQAGKTTILRTVELAVNGRSDEKPTKRDGSKFGSAEVFGKTLKINRVIREDGDLGLEGLGDFDLSTLHQPKFKDAETRDKYRIATLVRLSGMSADQSAFYDLLGGKEKFEEIAGDVVSSKDDLVDMVAKVKRAIDKSALAIEKDAIKAQANCDALSVQFDGVDMDVQTDEKVLNAILSDAIVHHQNLKAGREHGLAMLESRKKAQEAIESHGIVDVGPLITKEQEAQGVVDDLQKKLERIKLQLEVAIDDLDDSQSAVADAKKRNDVVAEHVHLLNTSGTPVIVEESEIEKANSRVDEANAAIETACKVRAAKAAQEQFVKHQKEHAEFEKAARKLRTKASSVSDVLSDAIAKIANCPFRVLVNDDGVTRLVVKGRKADEFFDELSDGAKWTQIIPMLCDKAGKLVVLSQSAWGEIQPKNKQSIHSMFAERECYLLTAQVDDGELRCEVFAGA